MSDSTGWLTVRARLRSLTMDAPAWPFLGAVIEALDSAEALNNHRTADEWAETLGPLSYDGRRPSVTESLRLRLDASLEKLIETARTDYARSGEPK